MKNKTVGIVNYGLSGNIYNIAKAVKKAGGSVTIINTVNDFDKVKKIIIPGVGSFKDAMQELESSGLLKALKKEVTFKPTLGICLGMQILAKIGFEYGKTDGLNFIDAEVKPMQINAKIPHMGFNSITIEHDNELFNGIASEKFYFMHSYEMVNSKDILSTTTYAGHSFVSSVQKNHIYGVQFHPEKSREAGIKFFENFIEIEKEEKLYDCA